VVRKKAFSNEDFIASVRAYLPMEARIRETNAEGNAGTEIWLDDLTENTFYHFDAEALHALCHSVEDIAMEEANGSLLAAFQDFRNFESHRELYTHLAATIDSVEVLGTGTLPARLRNIKFIPDSAKAGREFCLVLYQGNLVHAVVLARQANSARAFEEKQFVGCYSFNAGLVARVRQEVLALARGDIGLLREFSRLQAIDQAAKQIQREFIRQTEAIGDAMRRLQLDGEHCSPGHFASVLEKGLSQLHEWKTRVPELLARAARG
jgi:hypothetical protein